MWRKIENSGRKRKSRKKEREKVWDGNERLKEVGAGSHRGRSKNKRASLQ